MARIMLGNDLSGSAVTSQVPASTAIAQEKIVVQCVSGAVIKEMANGSIVAVDPDNTSQTLRSSGGTNYTVTLPDDFGVAAVVDRTAASWRYLSRSDDGGTYAFTDDQNRVPLADAVHVETLKQTITQVGAGGALTVKHRLTALAPVVPGYRPAAVIGYSFASSDTRDSYLDDFISFMCDFYLRVNSAGKYAIDYTCAFINNTASAIAPRVWFDILYLPV